MSDIISTIKKLPSMESYAPPASDEAIKNAEEKLNLKFAEDYREYLSVFGAVCSDEIRLSGITDANYEYKEEDDVVELTNKLRPYYSKIPLNFYALEYVGMDGLVIWQDETGVIYQSITGSEPFRIQNSLADFLEYCIKD